MRSPTRTSRIVIGVVAVAIALLVPPGAGAQDSARARAVVSTAPAPTVATARIAQQLGSKLVGEQPAELFVGASATAILADPTRLAAFGLRDARPGARVTILRSSGERLRVEVDEFEPIARTRRLTLTLDADGRLSAGTR